MPTHPFVLIVGKGIAASALACLLRQNGVEAVIEVRRDRRPGTPSIEAIPQTAVDLLVEIGLGTALTAATAVTVGGFDNRLHGRTHHVDGVWTHVDRELLASRCLHLAARRGAVLTDDHVRAPIRAFAVVDATGRAARLSRPIARARPGTATIFTCPGPVGAPRAGLIARTDAGWVYRLDHPSATTVGVVTERKPPSVLDPHTAGSVGIDHAAARRTAVRPCAVQWTVDPIGHHRIAVGDAALALNPLAGQGIRFALASAFASAAVIGTWFDGGDAQAAEDYYRTFVDGARTRHLANMTALLDEAPPEHQPHPSEASSLDRASVVSFTAASTTTGQNRNGRIVTEEAFRLPDGGVVRFVGGVDLTWLREAALANATVAGVCRELLARSVNPRTASSLVSWALQHGVLSATPPCPRLEQGNA